MNSVLTNPHVYEPSSILREGYKMKTMKKNHIIYMFVFVDFQHNKHNYC